MLYSHVSTIFVVFGGGRVCVCVRVRVVVVFGGGVLLLFYLNTSSIPCGKFGSPYRGTTAAVRAALPILVSVCSIFVCPNNCMAASVTIFNVRTYIHTCDCACGLTDTVRVRTERRL